MYHVLVTLNIKKEYTYVLLYYASDLGRERRYKMMARCLSVCLSVSLRVLGLTRTRKGHMKPKKLAGWKPITRVTRKLI